MLQTQTKYWSLTWSTTEGVCISIHTRWNFHCMTPLTQMIIDTGTSESVLQKPYLITMKHLSMSKGWNRESTYYRKFIRNFAKIAKPLTLLTHQQANFDWTPTHPSQHFFNTQGIQAAILHYPNPQKCYKVYTNASDNACGVQLSQEHDETEFPIAFLSHAFTDTQWKWSTIEQEAYGVYYTVAKWNYYLQGAKIIVHNNHKQLERFLNGKNANTKVNRWEFELVTYNITFEWISGAHNKAADYLSCLVELPRQTGNMLPANNLDGPAFNTKSRTAQHSPSEDTTPQTDAVEPNVTDTPSTIPKSLTVDRLQALLQILKTNPFCKWISKQLSNGKAPKHEADPFLYVKGPLYKHITDSYKKFLALVIPKAWKFTVLVGVHDKIGHQGATHSYCLIKHQHYWKGMNNDIRKYIVQCALCHREKAKVQA